VGEGAYTRPSVLTWRPPPPVGGGRCRVASPRPAGACRVGRGSRPTLQRIWSPTLQRNWSPTLQSAYPTAGLARRLLRAWGLPWPGGTSCPLVGAVGTPASKCRIRVRAGSRLCARAVDFWTLPHKMGGRRPAVRAGPSPRTRRRTIMSEGI